MFKSLLCSPQDLPCLLAKPVHRPNNFGTISPSSWWGWGGRGLWWYDDDGDEGNEKDDNLNHHNHERSAADKLLWPQPSFQLLVLPFLRLLQAIAQTLIPTWNPTLPHLTPPYFHLTVPFSWPKAPSFNLSKIVAGKLSFHLEPYLTPPYGPLFMAPTLLTAPPRPILTDFPQICQFLLSSDLLQQFVIIIIVLSLSLSASSSSLNHH